MPTELPTGISQHNNMDPFKKKKEEKDLPSPHHVQQGSVHRWGQEAQRLGGGAAMAAAWLLGCPGAAHSVKRTLVKCTDGGSECRSGGGAGSGPGARGAQTRCAGLVCLGEPIAGPPAAEGWRQARDLQPTTAEGGGEEEACGAAAPSRVTFGSSRGKGMREGSWEGTPLPPERGHGPPGEEEEAGPGSKILLSGPADTKAKTSLTTRGAGRPSSAVHGGGCPGGVGFLTEDQKESLLLLERNLACTFQRGVCFH